MGLTDQDRTLLREAELSNKIRLGINTNQNRRRNVSDGDIACRAFSFGVFLGGMMMLVMVMAFTPNWHKQAIEHNAARYNATTGKFEWIERGDDK